MNALVYYIGGETAGITPARLVELQLGHALLGSPFSARGCSRGPDGGAGVVVADRRLPVERLGYFPDRQTWMRFGNSAVWCGYDVKPGPEDLLREQALPGHVVRLADGREWLCPVAVACENGAWVNNLPALSTLGADGKWTVGATQAEYAELWRMACRWRDIWVNAMQGPQQTTAPRIAIDFDELHDWAARALGTNYRIGRVECAALGLFTAAAARDVLLALIDWPTWLEYLEKKAPAGPSSGGPG